MCQVINWNSLAHEETEIESQTHTSQYCTFSAFSVRSAFFFFKLLISLLRQVQNKIVILISRWLEYRGLRRFCHRVRGKTIPFGSKFHRRRQLRCTVDAVKLSAVFEDLVGFPACKRETEMIGTIWIISELLFLLLFPYFLNSTDESFQDAELNESLLIDAQRMGIQT